VQEIKELLKTKLKAAKRIAFLGVGSELRQDDASGMLIAEYIENAFRNKTALKCQTKVFFGSTAPENLTGKIKEFNPTHLVIIDSIDIGKPSGTISLITSEEIGGISFSTHRLPLKIMIQYLNEFLKSQILIIGIQPKTIEFGNILSKEVTKSVKLLSGIIIEILMQVK